MKKNGFTLIELLAVIVILAIIALIAVPIILNIIDDAEEKSAERSIELYASAVKNAIAAYRLNNTVAPENFSDLTVEYDGDVECKTQILYPDKTIYLAGCTVNDGEKEYSYGKKQFRQVYKPQYYTFDLSGTVDKTAAPSNSSNIPPEGKQYYLGYDVTEGVISTAYVCFKRNGIEYCLKGNDKSAFATNTEIIKDAFKDIVETEACHFDSSNSWCDDNVGALADNFDAVQVRQNPSNARCVVTFTGGFYCEIMSF